MRAVGVAAVEEGSLFAGIRVVDAGIMIGGPSAATFMGDFGAEVIKIEQPGSGDPVRQLLPHKEGVPLWWKVLSRNKKSVTLDLHHARGQEVFKRLVARSDVLVESFRPGTLEKWNIGWEALEALNPALVMLRISGFGQTGPYRHRPGFGRFAEAFSGLAHITGMGDGPPLHAGIPLADYIAGLMGWAAVASALYRRDASGTGRGQCIDLALFEAVFRLMDFAVIEYDQLGYARTRMGNVNPYVAPVNTYRTAGGDWVSFTASTQSIVERLFQAMGCAELIADPRFCQNEQRVRHREELDGMLASWFKGHTLAEVEEIFDRHGVPFAPILDGKGIVEDEHYRAREDVIRVDDSELGPVRMQAALPKFSLSRGEVRWAGPALGAHNREVLCGVVGLSEEELRVLQEEGVV